MRPFQSRTNKQNAEERSGMIHRMKQFFSSEPQQEKVLRHEDFQVAGDIYYARVSAGYKVVQHVIWIFFVLFMVISVIANYSSITYDNFYYLIKDFSSAATTEGANYETLSYESDSRNKFTLYRGGIAMVSPSKISVFTATGRRTLNTTSSFSSPYMIGSDRYLLIYDTSGKNFSLYNSFARIHTETLDYPIYDACFGEDGSFAVVTRTADSSAAIYVYDKSFKFAGGITNDLYVFDLDMSKTRNLLSFLSYDLGNGIGRTVLSVRNLKTLSETKSLSFEGEFPLGCTFLENNLIAVVTDRYVRIFDKNFEQKAISRDYSSETIAAYNFSDRGISVVTKNSLQNYVLAFDKSGNLLYNDSVRFHALDVCVYDSFVFLQTEQGVTRISAKTNAQESLPCGQGKMMIYNQNTSIVCGESKAEYLIFRNE